MFRCIGTWLRHYIESGVRILEALLKGILTPFGVAYVLWRVHRTRRAEAAGVRLSHADAAFVVRMVESCLDTLPVFGADVLCGPGITKRVSDARRTRRVAVWKVRTTPDV